MFLQVLTLLALALFVQCQTFQDPIRNPGADPHIVTSGGYYYLTNTGGSSISVTRSTTLGQLYNGETRTVWADSDTSRNQNTWAPEMHNINGIWYIFYTAGDGDPGNQRSYVIQGCKTNPYDCTYTFQAELTPAPGGQGGNDLNDAWSIDGTYLVINNQSYHVVSAINPQGSQSIQITELDTTAWTVGPWSIISSPTNDWEMAQTSVNGPGSGEPTAVNEGPNPLYHNGNTWLSFSASWCGTANYSLGLLAYDGSGDPLSEASWTKTGPVFQSGNSNYGTGHNVFFQSPDGTEIWNGYHATTNPAGSCGGDRYTMAQIVDFDVAENPQLGVPVEGVTAINVPSGDGLDFPPTTSSFIPTP